MSHAVDGSPISPATPTTTSLSPTSRILLWADQNRWWLLAAVVVIYAVGFNGQWRIGPDSALHVVTAQELAAGEGYTHPTGHQRTINPGLSQLTALTLRLFGSDQFVAIHVVLWVMGLAALALTYWLIRMRFDRPTAVVVTCMVAVAETYYQYCFEILTDIPFFLGLMLLLVGYELLKQQRWRILVGLILLAMGVLIMAAFRSVVLTAVAALGLAIVVQVIRGPQRWRFTSILVTAGVALILIRTLDPRFSDVAALGQDENRAFRMLLQELPATIVRALSRNLPKLTTETIAEATVGADLGPILSVPVAIAIVYAGLRLFRTEALWGLMVLAFFMQWLLFITADRYLLVLLPLLALGWWQLAVAVETRFSQRPLAAVGVAMVVLWVAPNLVAEGKFIVEQRRRPFLTYHEDGRYVGLKQLGLAIREHVTPQDLVIAEEAPQLVYYSRMRVVGADRVKLDKHLIRGTMTRLQQAERLWLVEPIGERLTRRLGLLPVERGEIVATVPRDGKPPLVLRRLHLTDTAIPQIENEFTDQAG